MESVIDGTEGGTSNYHKITGVGLVITCFDPSHLPFRPIVLCNQSLKLALGVAENKLDAGLDA